MAYKLHERDLRGKTKTGWLDSYHTFSFGDFRDPERMGFRSLRVINEDYIVPGSGFPTHPHQDMEIITYMIDGALEHKDSMGNGSVIRPGEIQKMSAGTGVTHSEFNASNDNSGHLLQIWIRPSERGIKPAYEQIKFDPTQAENEFVVVGSSEGGKNVISIYQDVQLLMAAPMEGTEVSYEFDAGRYGFLQIVSGSAEIDGEILKQGDGLEISNVSAIHVKALADSQLMLFDLA